MKYKNPGLVEWCRHHCLKIRGLCFSMKEEIWKPVSGYELEYEVSNFGNVRSLERKVSRRGYGVIIIKEKFLKQFSRRSDGYLSVGLHKIGLPLKTMFVHQLVARAFIPNPENKPCVDHINGIRNDNRVENLRWCTIKENNNFELARKHFSEGKLGEKNGMFGMSGKYSPSHKPVFQYDLNGNFIKKYYGIAEAQKETGILFQNISKVCKGKRNTAGGYIWRYEHEMIPIYDVVVAYKTKNGIIKTKHKMNKSHDSPKLL